MSRCLNFSLLPFLLTILLVVSHLALGSNKWLMIDCISTMDVKTVKVITFRFIQKFILLFVCFLVMQSPMTRVLPMLMRQRRGGKIVQNLMKLHIRLSGNHLDYSVVTFKHSFDVNLTSSLLVSFIGSVSYRCAYINI